MPPSAPFRVADSVHVHFNRVIQGSGPAARRIVRDADRRLEVATQVGFVIDDFHRAAARKYVRWANHQQVADLFSLFRQPVQWR